MVMERAEIEPQGGRSTTTPPPTSRQRYQHLGKRVDEAQRMSTMRDVAHDSAVLFPSVRAALHVSRSLVR